MTTITCTTQTELDAALARTDLSSYDTIYINSTNGVWLRVNTRSASNSNVVARGNSNVEARGNSNVEARGNSNVEAWENSNVVAWENSNVVARGNSNVVARENSNVVARENSNVVARENSNVVARENSNVEAGKYVSVHLHSARATVNGGVIIDVTALDLTQRGEWIGYYGLKVTDGTTVVYKAVDSALNAGHHHVLTGYAIGSTVTAPDWLDTRECGNGLHFGITPQHAKGYYTGEGPGRYLACEVDVSTLVPLGDKLKVPSCRVLHEVDAYGRAVTPASS